VVRKEEKV
jgi:hypothetical protein